MEGIVYPESRMGTLLASHFPVSALSCVTLSHLCLLQRLDHHLGQAENAQQSCSPHTILCLHLHKFTLPYLRLLQRLDHNPGQAEGAEQQNEGEDDHHHRSSLEDP